MKNYILLLSSFFICLIWFTEDAICSSKCIRTPELINRESMPNQFSYSSDLSHDPGSFEVADGVRIRVHGVIFDQGCIPLQGAVLSLWQPNEKGEFEKSGVWSGRASSDNLGQYEFKTVKSALKGSKVPFVNVVINKVGFVPFETSIFFDDEDNKKSKMFLKLSKSEQHFIVAKYEGFMDNIHTYSYDIVIGGHEGFKHG